MACQQTAPLKRIRRSVHDWLTLSLQGIMLATIVFAVLEGQWFNGFLVASILLITLTPRLVGKRFAVHIPAEFETVTIVFVFAALFLGEIGGYYEKFWWWDVLLHTASGFLLGVLGVLLVYVLNRDPRIELHMKPGFVCLFAFTFAVAIGAVWEIFEYAMDGLFGMNMQKSGLVDTMWDLIVDTLGALAVAILGYVYMRSGAESFVERWIVKFIAGNPRFFEKTPQK